MCEGQAKQCEECSTTGLINFYKKGIERNSVYFYDQLANALYLAESAVDEDERQRIIMEDAMMAFDYVACKGKDVTFATDLFVGYHDDTVTDFQLGIIKQCGDYPKVSQSCSTISEEGY